ncbi:zinc ribbon domain-containing protein [Anaerolineales bacterium HSG24]|nr:zinc ribbon domain-containing protein [Anaerolineales bacterium HSG24]
MPIYEYGCYDCRKKVSVFFRSFAAAQTEQAICPRCKGDNIKRLISKVAFIRSEESRMESLADPSSLAGLDENDPKSMAKWLRKMGKEAGEDMGDEFDEVVGRLESGEDPESIEKSMPGLAGAADDWNG